MFAPHVEIAKEKMLGVTKPGGYFAFSTWPFELVYGKLFKAMSKHMPANTANSIYTVINQNNSNNLSIHRLISLFFGSCISYKLGKKLEILSLIICFLIKIVLK
jgi:hypothetical protein